MKLVIDIHEKDYKLILNRRYVSTGAVDAIMHGTPLPKGHGRLIDADALEKEIVNGIKAGNYEEGYETFAHINDMDDCLECVKYADTIIEADKDCRECKAEHDCLECEKYEESEDEK